MKTILLALTFSLLSISAFSQSTPTHGGYIYVVEELKEGYSTDQEYVYYVSPYLSCDVPADADEGLKFKKDSEQAFKNYVLENYTLKNMGPVIGGEWMMPRRGINPEQIYQKKLENLEKVGPGGKVIIVEGFSIDCK